MAHGLERSAQAERCHAGSNRQVWWRCGVGPDHVWRTSVANRSKGRGCPFCRGLKASSTNNLATLRPETAKYWHRTRNDVSPSEVTVGSNKTFWWKCPEGSDHEWETQVVTQVAHKGCPFCAGKRVSVTNCLASVAPQLAMEWHPIKNDPLTPRDVVATSHTKVWWKCHRRGHEWLAELRSRVHGNNCPYFANQLVDGDNSLASCDPDVAAQWDPLRNGDLTPAHVTPGAKLAVWWKCDRGHSWRARVYSRTGVHRRGCPHCAKNARLTLADMHAEAVVRGGQCLSVAYVNSTTALRWRCAEGHEWESSPSMVRSGNWCPRCAGKAKRTVEEMSDLAESRGGKCISRTCRNVQTKLTWECAEGHRWRATPKDVIRGTWCPECGSGLGERSAEPTSNSCLAGSSPGSDPDGCEARLDIDLNSMVSADHWGWPLNIMVSNTTGSCPSSTTAHKALNGELYDTLKREACEEHGVVLIEVPEIPSLLAINDVRHRLAELLAAAGVDLPADFHTRPVNLRPAYATSRTREELDRCSALARRNQGRLISSSYVNDSTKLKWECAKNHVFLMSPGSVKQGQWCPECRGSKKLTIDDMDRIAAARGGKCVDRDYVNANTPMLWQCSVGHRWKAVPGMIKSGNWCPFCAGNAPATIGQMRDLATAGWRRLSTSYGGNHKKLCWRCAGGHEWEATPAHVKNGTWCPVCGGRQRKILVEVRALAKSRGGECLTDVYTNAQTRLRWRCASA